MSITQTRTISGHRGNRSGRRSSKSTATKTHPERLGAVLVWLILLGMFVGLTPFMSLDPGLGSAINKGYWLIVGGLAVVSVFRTWATSKVLIARFWPVGVPLAWFSASIFWSDFPTLTLERFVILGIMSATTFAVAASQVPKQHLARILLIIAGAALFVNVASVILVPDLTITLGGKFHGMFGNSNTAGTATALTLLAFLWAIPAARDRKRQIGATLMAGLALWFLIGTESATSITAVFVTPIGILVLLLSRRLSLVSRFVALGITGLAAAVGLASLVVFGLGAGEIAEVTLGDTTLTGRTFLWEALWVEIRNHPWVGSAYGAFWYLDSAPNALYATSGFLGRVGQAHNGYIDLVLQVGIVGFVAAMVPLVHMGMLATRYSHRMRDSRSRKWLSLLPLGLLVFLIVHNFLESSLFRSGSTLTMAFFLGYFLVGSWDLLDKTRVKRRRSKSRRRRHSRSSSGRAAQIEPAL